MSMTVVNFRNKGHNLANANYVEVSPVDERVASALFRLANTNVENQHWVKKGTLDRVLGYLGKEGLEATILKGEDPFKMNQTEFTDRFSQSVIYPYNAEGQLVRVTPTPFATGPEVEKYFAIRSPEYVGR